MSSIVLVQCFWYCLLLGFIVVVTYVVKWGCVKSARYARKVGDIELFRRSMYEIWKFSTILTFALSEPYMYLIDKFILHVPYPGPDIALRIGVYWVSIEYLIALKTGKMKWLWAPKELRKALT